MKALVKRNNLKDLLPLAALSLVLSAQLPALAAGKGNKPEEKAPTMAEEVWRKNPPQLPAPRPFNMPKVETFKLSNGLEVQFLEDHRFPFTSINLGFRSGSAQEPADLTGVAEMTSAMLTQGTTRLSSKELASQVEFIGGALKASTDYDYSLLSGSCLSGYSDKMLSLMSEVLLSPSFPEDELKLKKVNTIQALTIKRSDPDFLIEERFSKVVFGAHPYSLVSPTEADINKLTRADLVNYHASHYVPNSAVLIVVGDFDPGKMKTALEEKFGKVWQPKDLPTVQEAKVPTHKGRKIYLVDRPGSVQTSIKVGNLGIKRNDPDYFAMLVTNQILGGTAHARLFLNIREAKGFTYGAYSKLAARKEPGAFFAEADVRTEVTNPSLQEFFYELERMRSTKVKEEEIKAAKNYLAGSFQLGLETQAGIAQRLLEAKLFDLPADYLQTYADKVMAVNVEDVQKSARKLIDAQNLVVCIVGDAKKIKSELAVFAPVAVYDSDGKLSSEEAEKSLH